MKYISLIGALRFYGNCIADMRSMHQINYDLASRGFDAHQDYHVFNIETGEPDKSGQVMKTIRFCRDLNIYSIMGRTQPDHVVMPPILEIEWLSAVMDISGNYKEILEYLSYMFIMQVVSWNDTLSAVDAEWYSRVLDNRGAIIELENLAITPIMLSEIELPSIKLPKIKTWHTLYAYGPDFNTVFRLCRNQSQSTKILYHHMPIMLTLFMVSYKATKLKGWEKSERIQTENDLRDYIRNFGTQTVAGPVPVTYGGCVNVTGQDMAFMRYVFDAICKYLSNINNDMGLINIYEYRNVRGPERIRANVRLSNMSINWRVELKKAEDEKKAREEEAEG